MEKKHIITLAGKPGSGKSTTSKGVASELGYKHFSSGDLFRAIGKERGIDVFQTNIAAETEQDIDHMVDEKLRTIWREEDELVIDSRMAWHWMPHSFKVYLDLDLEIAAKRILSNYDPKRLEYENIPEKPSEYAEVLQGRLDSEIKRYMNLYQANPYDTKNYNLVVDTSAHTPEAAIALIVEKFHTWQNT